nr:MAG TPA: YqeY-like protein [Caudoviricetes sp.]
MELKALQNEMIKAMKSGDKFRKSVISTVIARIKNTAIDKGCRDNITEDMVNAELLKAKKVTQEMLDTCPASRTDLLEDYKKQMDIICEFAPTLITDPKMIEDNVKDIASQNHVELAKSNRGALMKLVAAELKGKADMSVVSKVVGKMLV